MRKGILGSVAALLTGGGMALGQGYPLPPGYYPPPGYPVPMQMAPMQMPMAPMMPGQMPPMQMVPMQGPPMQLAPMPAAPMMAPTLQGMPQGYGQPYYPMPEPPRPVLRGWPPPAGAIPTGPDARPTLPPAPPSLPAAKTAEKNAVKSADARSTDAKSTDAKNIAAGGVPTLGKGVLGLPAVRRAEPVADTADTGNETVNAPVSGQMPVRPVGFRRRHAHSVMPAAPEPMVDPAPGSPLMCENGACSADGCHDGACQTAPCEPPHAPIPCKEPRGYHCYASPDFLYWFFRHQQSPPLAIIPDPRGTRTINANTLDPEDRVGARLTLGTWLSGSQNVAIEGNFFYIAPRNCSELIQSSSITMPFTDATNGGVYTTPATAGTEHFNTFMNWYGAEINLKWEVARWSCGHLGLLGGMRFMQLDETLDMQTNQTSGILVADSFGTHNQFWGGQLGAEGELNRGRYFISGFAKIAVGDLQQSANINGVTYAADTTTPGGFYALPSNMGHYRRDRIGLLPEAGGSIGMQLCPSIRVHLGYSAMFLFHAIRPGELIDPVIGGVAGSVPSPVFRWNEQTFWAQGFNAGFEFRF